MERDKSSASRNVNKQPNFDDQVLAATPIGADPAPSQNLPWHSWPESAGSCHPESQLMEVESAIQTGHESRGDPDSMTVGDFVKVKFIPEYVSAKRTSGQAHFQSILSYVLTPEQTAHVFPAKRHRTKVTSGEIPSWPYLGLLPLRQVSADTIQHLTSTALEFGYSIQTATHIRNVLRAIFAHALATKTYSGENPAALVRLPRMARKEPHSLTVSQLKELISVMRYPEKQIALFATLTDMNLSEICGLQWKYANPSTDRRLVAGEWIPGRTIAVRRQSYRGQHGAVTMARQRFVPAPDLICSILSEIKTRKRFTGPEDFVFVSRNGTLIYPENIAARRLKPIGRTLEMPWLSWNVFHRTYATLGRALHKELRSIYLSPGWYSLDR